MTDARSCRRARVRPDRADARRAPRQSGARRGAGHACSTSSPDGGRRWRRADRRARRPRSVDEVARARRRRGGDLHEHRHPRRADHRSPPRRASRRSARSRSRSTSPRSTRRSRRSTTAGTLLQVGFNRRFDPAIRPCSAAGGERRARRRCGLVKITSRDNCPPPVAYLATLGRHVPRHDDPRLRHGPLRRGQRGRRGVRRRRRARRPGDRARSATSTRRSSCCATSRAA